MRILYLHGLHSSPHTGKVGELERRGHEVVAPHIKYEEFSATVAIFDWAKELVEREQIEYIVGSSMGGFLGYWLGQAMEVPQLLFNPALAYNSMLFETPPVEVRDGARSWVVLGKRDETIPAQLNIDFFVDKVGARVVVAEWLGHRIDMETFVEMVNWANL